MRDDRHKWTPSGTFHDGFSIGDIVLSPVSLDRQVLMSGPQVLTQTDVPLVEWPEVCDDGSYALVLRRDRVLMVNGPETAEGWDDARSLAISDASDLYSVLELSGPGAVDVLKRGTEISLSHPSRSVVRRFFGLEVMLYRHGGDNTFRLHVARAHADALIGYLKSAAEAVGAARTRSGGQR